MNKTNRFCILFVLISAFFVFLLSSETIESEKKISEPSVESSDVLNKNGDKGSAFTHDEENIPFTAGSEKIEKEQHKVESFWLLLRVLVVLFIVIFAAYFILLLLKKATRIEENDDPFFRLITMLNIGNGKNIALITLVDKAYIVGVSDSTLSLIAEINDKDLVDSMNVYFDKKRNVSKPRNFSDILNIFLKNTKKPGSIYSEEEDFGKPDERE